MNTYVLLLRGINVGGKNKLPMAELKTYLEEQGCTNVTTYIQSGNVIVQSALGAKALSQKVEDSLPKKFKLDSSIIKILALTHDQLKAVIGNKPTGFGDEPEKYRCEAVFLMGIPTSEAMTVFAPREGVDQIWPGAGVIYSQRLIAQITKSRIGKIVGTLPYQSMTIRNWNTTTKLLKMLDEMSAQKAKEQN
ncbi:MAG TPA: DUF1697 domain-containing protein [Patescibacteria group bacterium]|nr:DUF1697 domain-containing protein [Patescibacteria group bacterium]